MSVPPFPSGLQPPHPHQPPGLSYDAYPAEGWEPNPDQPSAQLVPPPRFVPGSAIPPKGGALATLALVLGLASVPLSFIPVVNVLAVILGIGAIVTGVAALLKHTTRGFSVTGIVTGAFGILTSLAVLVVFALSSTVHVLVDEPIQPPEPWIETVVEFSAETSYGPATVTWGDNFYTDVLDFEDSFSGDRTLTPDASVFLLHVAGDPTLSDQTVSCQILVDGAVVSEQSAQTSVTCAYDVPR